MNVKIDYLGLKDLSVYVLGNLFFGHSDSEFGMFHQSCTFDAGVEYIFWTTMYGYLLLTWTKLESFYQEIFVKPVLGYRRFLGKGGGHEQQMESESSYCVDHVPCNVTSRFCQLSFPRIR